MEFVINRCLSNGKKYLTKILPGPPHWITLVDSFNIDLFVVVPTGGTSIAFDHFVVRYFRNYQRTIIGLVTHQKDICSRQIFYIRILMLVYTTGNGWVIWYIRMFGRVGDNGISWWIVRRIGLSRIHWYGYVHGQIGRPRFCVNFVFLVLENHRRRRILRRNRDASLSCCPETGSKMAGQTFARFAGKRRQITTSLRSAMSETWLPTIFRWACILVRRSCGRQSRGTRCVQSLQMSHRQLENIRLFQFTYVFTFSL